MNIRRVVGFELYNMEKPDPYNETMTFKSRDVAERTQRLVGGEIRTVFIHIKEES